MSLRHKRLKKSIHFVPYAANNVIDARAEQIRAEQATFPALGLVGECATDKTILAELICKLSGREDCVELDPNRISPQILERMLASP